MPTPPITPPQTRSTLPQTVRCYIGLGSNLGDSIATLRSALQQLDDHADIQVAAVSSAYRSKPHGPQNQPDYLNAVAALDTSLTALAVLDTLLAVERQHGRRRDPNQHWGPRTLDLDLLLYADQQLQDSPDGAASAPG
ncbi:MAG: 2-amino-4-hydroxy-6-hydroxymethyldihydropteridine diphosphokinase [Thiolinea sp.]